MPDYLPRQPLHIQEFAHYHTLKANWHFSCDLLSKLETSLKNAFPGEVRSIAVAGSIGRLEGSEHSDLDYIMIVTDKTAGPPNISRMNDILKELRLPHPNPKGIFSQARTITELIEGAGDANESLDLLGKRMLLLLESRPAYRADEFERCVREVFQNYASLVVAESSKEFVFLLNDLIRYFRSICVNYQSNFVRENEKWAIRNVKLRHSRLIMYGGLLLLLGEASRQRPESKVEWLIGNLTLTPLDRIALVYKCNHDPSFFRIAGLYNVFHARLSDLATRTALNIDYEDRYTNPVFSELKANSDALVAELTRFIFGRRGIWSERFFEYLIW